MTDCGTIMNIIKCRSKYFNTARMNIACRLSLNSVMPHRSGMLASGLTQLQLHSWWNQTKEKGPAFSYFAQSAKSSLIVKKDRLANSEESFSGSGVHSMCTRKCYLGVALQIHIFVEEYA